ncbi:MAG: radical SAM protein [Candidatus Pacearchaeota archaeon]|nr:radical SAM protein [Candidatus Pacearchaeota archaeon]
MKNKSEKYFDYDTFINWALTTKCNFECEYCFNKFEPPSPPLKPIDIKKVIRTLRKTKRKYLITFSGGEPFLIPNFIELCKALTKEHYISICTNLSCTEKIKQFAKEISPEKVKSIHASCHVMEHERKGINSFIENHNMLKKNNFFIDAGYVIYPPLLSRFEKDILYYRSKGIIMYGREFIGYYENKKYPESYSKKDKKRILKYYTIGQSYLKGTPCNAGYNTVAVVPNGDVLICYFVPLKLGNIYKKIEFNKKMIICPIDACQCPLKLFEPKLFSSACKQTIPYTNQEQESLINSFKIKSHHNFNLDKFIGKIGISIKRHNPNLYYKLKKIKDAQ